MLTIVQAALEAGFLYAPIALALFLSFSILNIADMTTDGAFVLGSAVSAMMCLSGHPILALPAGMAAAAAAGRMPARNKSGIKVAPAVAAVPAADMIAILMRNVRIVAAGISSPPSFLSGAATAATRC